MASEKENKRIEFRSEPVQEILGTIPSWIIRWGTTLFFSIIVLLLVGSWYFSYPEVVPNLDVELVTTDPPAEVVARSSGKIDEIFIRDKQMVAVGDSIAVIDVESREVVGSIPVGGEPHGLVMDQQGKRLYVLNTSSDSISVIDAVSLEETWRLSSGRRPWSVALSPDGTRIAVTSALPEFAPFRTSSRSELTLIDAETGAVDDRVIVPDANLLQGVAWHPSGEFALFTLNRTKNLVPMTRLLQGWTITNGLGIVWRDGRVDQVLLDEPNMGFPNPTDVAITPDGSRAFVTSSGTDRVAVVEVATLISMLEEATDKERRDVFPNHLGKPTEFVIGHIPTLTSPRGLVVSPDGQTVYVANGLDDSVTVIDVATLEAVDRIDLGGPAEITLARYGERLFNSADIAFNRQFACSSCHPDGHVDGLSYDIEPDGIGLNPVGRS